MVVGFFFGFLMLIIFVVGVDFLCVLCNCIFGVWMCDGWVKFMMVFIGVYFVLFVVFFV